MLHVSGSKRCPPMVKGCMVGCSIEGGFNGKPDEKSKQLLSLDTTGKLSVKETRVSMVTPSMGMLTVFVQVFLEFILRLWIHGYPNDSAISYMEIQLSAIWRFNYEMVVFNHQSIGDLGIYVDTTVDVLKFSHSSQVLGSMTGILRIE